MKKNKNDKKKITAWNSNLYTDKLNYRYTYIHNG